MDLWPVGELMGWLAYAQCEALPDAHFDAAMIAFTNAKIWGYKGKIDEFLPTVGEPKVISHKELKAKLIVGLGAVRGQAKGG